MTDDLTLESCLQRLSEMAFGPLDLLPGHNFAEKVIDLALCGSPQINGFMGGELNSLAKVFHSFDTSEARVVVFGGGTGLSNVIGGDSRHPAWPRAPFNGLKEVFPRTRSIVCVTDDGGSSGELLKDLPVIALGDLRHVLLSSIRRNKLQLQYGLEESGAGLTASVLHRLFNHRFSGKPSSQQEVLDEGKISLESLPGELAKEMHALLDHLFADECLRSLLSRPHCLGNLLLVSALYKYSRTEPSPETIMTADAFMKGLTVFSDLLGANPDAVLPCTTTPANLKVLYNNGVLVTGEYKSSRAQRGYPVDRVFSEFTGEPEVPDGVCQAVSEADIIIFAPGSLYTSIVPILQVPGIAEEIRKNRRALKMLIANLWIQTGETDLVRDDPTRRFYISDLISAYNLNIPGGVIGLFSQVLSLGLRDIPGSILQSYALEDKVPIYLDREKVEAMGFVPIEAKICSQEDIAARLVIQHDPASLAEAVRTLYAVKDHLPRAGCSLAPVTPYIGTLISPDNQISSHRYAATKRQLSLLDIDSGLRERFHEIFWEHRDIPLAHLQYVKGVQLLDKTLWERSQKWDNIYSFYDPADGYIKIRQDISVDPASFRFGFLVALGESLLGNYAAAKQKEAIEREGENIGYVFRLTLREESERHCFLSGSELERYLTLARMRQCSSVKNLYTRMLNGDEGFTPPGLLFGLTYAWYLDNRFSCHLEYKMSIIRQKSCGFIPEQKKMTARRQSLIDFFRNSVFRFHLPQ